MRSALVLSLFLASGISSDVPTYVIDLDKAPEDRYLEVVANPQFNATVWKFWDDYFKDDQALQDVLFGLSDKRGDENEEMQREINGYAAASKLPLKFVQSIQMFYELQTIMVPVVNFTGSEVFAPVDEYPKGYEDLARIPWRGPGCTGIIATNAQDGTVNHARNLDFSPVDIFSKLVYNGIFMKNGVEIFQSQMIAGYTPIVTAVQFTGDNGYAVERNTRYTAHTGGYKEMIDNLIAGRDLNGWSLRKILETETEYEAAVEAIKTVPYASTEYAIVSGVKKGVIISRAPDQSVYEQVLGQPNYNERDDYVIITNFDYFWNDVREVFDPTGGEMFHPRRVVAQEFMNSTELGGLTGDVLFQTINQKGVIADTIFQAIINVESKVWNISQPDLASRRERSIV